MWHERLRRAEVFIFGVCDFDYITENWYFDKCEKVYTTNAIVIFINTISAN